MGEIDRRGVTDRSLIARRGERRIAFQRLAPTQQSERNLVPALSEQPCGDEAIAAIASRAAEEAIRPRDLRSRAASSATARPARSISAMPAVPAEIGEAVSLAHLSGRQEFRKRLRIAHGGESARGLPRAQAEKTPFASHRILLYPAHADPR